MLRYWVEQPIAELRRIGPSLADTIRPTPYVGHQALLDPGVPHGLGYDWKSESVAALSDPLIATLAEHAWRSVTPESYTIIFHLGGAVAREDPEGSAFEAAMTSNPLIWLETGLGSRQFRVSFGASFFVLLGPDSGSCGRKMGAAAATTRYAHDATSIVVRRSALLNTIAAIAVC